MNYVLKSISCPVEGMKYWAENSQDEQDWAYLTAEQYERLGGEGAEVEAETANNVVYGGEPVGDGDTVIAPKTIADAASVGSKFNGTLGKDNPEAAAVVSKAAKDAIDVMAADPETGNDRGYILFTVQPGEEGNVRIGSFGNIAPEMALTAFQQYAAATAGVPYAILAAFGGLGAWEAKLIEVARLDEEQKQQASMGLTIDGSVAGNA